MTESHFDDMIKALLRLDANGNISDFSVKGHSGSAEEGRDIICAAVSAIVQTALIGLDEVAGIKDTYDISEGCIECRLPDNCRAEKLEKAHTVLDVMKLGLLSIAEQYPEFVRVKVN